MGTNYYAVRNGEKYHIGKKSYGWRFQFSTEFGSSWKHIYEQLDDSVRIEDCYGKTHTKEELRQIVINSKNNEDNLIALNGVAHLDAQGFPFIGGHFV